MFTEYLPMQAGVADASVGGCRSPCSLATPVMLGSDSIVEARTPGQEVADGVVSSEPAIAEVQYVWSEEAFRECDPDLVFHVVAVAEGDADIIVLAGTEEIDRFTFSVRSPARSRSRWILRTWRRPKCR
jgi:hypothetical protein